MLRFTPLVYFSVSLSNHSLNFTKSLFIPFISLVGGVGLSSKVHSAGVSDKAMNAEMITDMAMVIANCW